jgi:hypothetical protein
MCDEKLKKTPKKTPKTKSAIVNPLGEGADFQFRPEIAQNEPNSL